MKLTTWEDLCEELSPNLSITHRRLKDGRTLHMDKEEKVRIAMAHWSTDSSYTELQYLYGLSASFLQKVIDEVAEAVIVTFKDRYLHPDGPFFREADPEVIPKSFDYRDHTFSSPYRHFEGGLGQLDGTHMRVVVEKLSDMARYRNRKGWPSNNVLLMCDDFLIFRFVFVGSEGSAGDAKVLGFSKLRAILNAMPVGCFALGDAGYGLEERILVPYQGVRYHLKEFRGAAGVDNRPMNAKELYNLRHSSLRVTIEKAIGVLKKRFKRLRTCLYGKYETQNRTIMACALLHNFIMEQFDEVDIAAHNVTAAEMAVDEAENLEATFNARIADADVNGVAESRRQHIANGMWREYCSDHGFSDEILEDGLIV